MAQKDGLHRVQNVAARLSCVPLLLAMSLTCALLLFRSLPLKRDYTLRGLGKSIAQRDGEKCSHMGIGQQNLQWSRNRIKPDSPCFVLEQALVVVDWDLPINL